MRALAFPVVLLTLGACTATPGPTVVEQADACAASITAAGDARALAGPARAAAIAARDSAACAASPAAARVAASTLDATLADWVKAEPAAACDAITTAALSAYGRAADLRGAATPAASGGPARPWTEKRPNEEDVVDALQALRPGLELMDAANRLCPDAAWLPSLRTRTIHEMQEHTNFSLIAAQNTDVLAQAVLDLNEAARRLAGEGAAGASASCPVMDKGLEAFRTRPHFTFQSDGRLDLFDAADKACKAGEQAIEGWVATYGGQVDCVPMVGRIRTGVPFAVERAAQGDVAGACQSIAGARDVAKRACAATPQRLDVARADLERLVGVCGWKSAWE